MSASTTAIIAEDEPVLRAELRETLSALWPDLVITAETGNGIDGERRGNFPSLMPAHPVAHDE